MLTQQILDKYNSHRSVANLPPLAQNMETYAYQISVIPWRPVATSPLLTDPQVTRIDDGTGHAGSVPLETTVAPLFAPTYNAPCVASSGPRLTWLTSGRRQAGEGSVLGFTHLRPLPSECHFSPFPLRSFAHKNTRYLEQTIILPPTLHHRGMLSY